MRYSLVVLCLFVGGFTYAQRALTPVGLDVLGKWPSADNAGISDDGRFYYYILNDGLAGVQKLFLQSDAGWKMEINKILPGSAQFSGDSKTFAFLQSKDSLGIVKLGTSSVEYIPNVRSFKCSPGKKTGCLVGLTNSPEANLILYKVASKKTSTLPGAMDYLFSKDGNQLLVKRKVDGKESIDLWDLISGKTTRIWKGEQVGSYTFDKDSRQLALIGKEANDSTYAIFYHNMATARTEKFVTKDTGNTFTEFMLSPGVLMFTNSGKSLMVYLENKTKPATRSTYPNVNIWSYQDRYLQSEQLSKGLHPQASGAGMIPTVVSIERKTIRALQKPDERLQWSKNADEHVLVTTMPASVSGYWAVREYKNIDLVSVHNGERKTIVHKKNFIREALSPQARFFTWYDVDSLAYYSYDMATGVTVNLSSKIPSRLYDEEAVQRGRRVPFGVAAWAPVDTAVFIYDAYDIWMVDPQGKRPSRCITNGFGRKNTIVFGTIPEEWSADVIISGQEILLSGYNRQTKLNGFWTVRLKPNRDPEKRIMAPYCFYIARSGLVAEDEYPEVAPPIKAGSANKYLIRRMSANEFPNWYVTSDFKSMKQISFIYPERSYNWLTSELVNWTTFDGTPSQGILYKPTNFDPTKKYPVIFDYYEKRSDQLHEYIYPELARGRINIPYFVSNGYLVFVPDVYFTPGHNGEGVLNCILSAAKKLAAMPWVDSTKMGLQGHSFGGWQTNYLITHSSLFAAACEASGVSNQTSGYNQLTGTGSDRQWFYEKMSQGSPYGKDVTPFNHLDLYMANSPVFFADRVSTPLLMMHGDKDPAVPYEQALEFFLALRRVEKKVWLLQYENEDHTLHNAINASDFTIRMKQFFDHYLKDSAAPRWMLYGIPARMKGIDDGLQLVKEKDLQTGKWLTPKEGGLLTDEERKKIGALKHRKPITVAVE